MTYRGMYDIQKYVRHTEVRMTTDCRRFCHFVCFVFFLILYGAPSMSLT